VWVAREVIAIRSLWEVDVTSHETMQIRRLVGVNIPTALTGLRELPPFVRLLTLGCLLQQAFGLCLFSGTNLDFVTDLPRRQLLLAAGSYRPRGIVI
jgi:hypothetical protein